jgi:hypothetical protein
MNTFQTKTALIALVAASIACAPGAFAKGGGGGGGGKSGGGGSNASSSSNSSSSHSSSSSSNSGGSKSFSNYRSYRYSGPPVCVRWERQNCVAWSN